jgi:uncharacterized membrane protein YqiK
MLIPLLYKVILVAVVFVIMLARFIRYIPNNRVAVKEVRLNWSGHKLESGRIMALAGQTGFQPDVMRGGIHLMSPFNEAHQSHLVTIPQGQIGYVYARDGEPLPPTQTLARTVECNNYQDVRSFLANGGQKGVQRAILREGTYAINTAQFVVLTQQELYYLPMDKSDDSQFAEMARAVSERQGFQPVVILGDQVGILTVHDGPSLEPYEIIAPIVGDDAAKPDFHNNFQDPEAFLRAGGRRGRQHQVLVEGTFYVNRLFATVETVPKTVIEVGTVGVVVAYTGAQGTDTTGDSYKHGELVEKGCRGVLREPLLPGKYALNTYAVKVVHVPTTNFILKWVRHQVGVHKFDENLQEVSLITKDAFEPSLPLSVVVHIDYKLAPRVIQRFGDIKRLVEQTLDPMVSAYFKNVGQTRTLIQLLQDRTAIQDLASKDMKVKFANYDLELEEVLLGTPAPSEGDSRIEDILTQLRLRQIAEEQVVTYHQQEKASVKERELREAESRARQQTAITESELAIQVQSNQGKALFQRSLQEAERVRTMSQAEADKIRALAEAEANKVSLLGEAEAEATSKKVAAYGGPRYQLTQQVMNRFAEAVERAGIDLVPRVMVGAGAGGGDGSNVMQALMTMLLSERMGVEFSGEEHLVASQLRAAASKPANGEPSAPPHPAQPSL